MRNGIVPNLNPSWGGAYQYRSYDALHFFGPSDHHTDELLESHVVKLRKPLAGLGPIRQRCGTPSTVIARDVTIRYDSGRSISPMPGSTRVRWLGMFSPLCLGRARVQMCHGALHAHAQAQGRAFLQRYQYRVAH